MISIKEQLSRGGLIIPYFHYLKAEESFQKEVKSLRSEYGLIKAETAEYKVPLYLLHQDYWHCEYDTMLKVNLYSEEMKGLWTEFHKKIEIIAKKYFLSNFPNLLKEYILEGRFNKVLMLYKLTGSTDWFDITVPRNIKKEDFMKIWKQIQDFNKDHPLDESFVYKYSKGVIKKYRSVEKINKKHELDKPDIILMMKKELLNNLSIDEEDKIEWWDRSKKSHLLSSVKDLLSLVKDLDEAKS